MAKRNSSNGHKIPAVGYIRMSSDKQDTSPQQQRDAIIELANRDSYRIIRWYADEGVSGDATEKRYDFQRMITDAESGDFRAVLCWDQDRFGRFDSIEAGRWIYPLREAGVHLTTCAQGKIDWGDFASRIVFGVQQEAKHAYLLDLSRNATRGLIARALRGEWVAGGNPPMGYVLRNHRPALGDSAVVELIRRIYREYLSGGSLQGLAKQLNQEGIKSPGGGLWRRSSVQAVLKNVRYTGTFVWNVSSRAKYNGVRNGAVTADFQRGLNDEGDWIVIENNHPAIIEREVFDAVQRRLTARSSMAGQPGVSSPSPGKFGLSGLLRCGECGSLMHGRTVSGHQYYSCGGYLEFGASFCNRNSVRQDQLIEEVVGAIEDNFTNPETVARLRDELRRQVRKSASKVSTASLRKKLASVDKKLTKYSERLVEVDLDMVSTVQEKIREARAERDRLQTELKAAATPQRRLLEDQDAKVDAALKLFMRLRETVKRADMAKLREFLGEAVSKVVLRVSKKKKGRLNSFRLLGGQIHMNSADLSSTPR